MRAISSIGVYTLALVLGIIFISLGVGSLKATSGNLVYVQAEILSSSVRTSDTGDKSYVISYKYQVNGVEYTGSVRSNIDYAPENTITVFYNPATPNVSFTSKEYTSSMGIVYLLVGLFLSVFFVRGVWKFWLRVREK